MCEWGTVSLWFAGVSQLQITSSTRYLELNGGNSDLWGKGLSYLRERLKNLLFFSEMVGRVGIEPTTN